MVISRKQPKKREAIDAIHDWFTSRSESMLNAGIKQDEINKFLTLGELRYTELLSLIRWIEETFEPIVDKHYRLYHTHTPEGWETLKVTSPSIKELISLRDRAKDVRVAWRNRIRVG